MMDYKQRFRLLSSISFALLQAILYPMQASTPSKKESQPSRMTAAVPHHKPSIQPSFNQLTCSFQRSDDSEIAKLTISRMEKIGLTRYMLCCAELTGHAARTRYLDANASLAPMSPFGVVSMIYSMSVFYSTFAAVYSSTLIYETKGSCT